MRKINIPKWFERVLLGLIFFLAVALLVLSLVFAQADIVKIIKDGDAIVDNESTAIVCLYAFYYVVLAAFLFWKSDEKKNKWKFAEISLCSFVLNCLVVPDLGFLLLFFLGKIVDKTCFLDFDSSC